MKFSLLFLLAAVTVAPAVEVAVPLGDYNGNLHAFPDQWRHPNTAQFPTGEFRALTGVTYSIPASGNNYWHSVLDSDGVLEIPANLFAVSKVHLLLNCFWGEQTEGSLAKIEFVGSGAATYTYDLEGDRDLRDYLFNLWANNINNTTTRNAFIYAPGVYQEEVRLDETTITLPPPFQNEILRTIRFVDRGEVNVQKIFVAGITAQTDFDPNAEFRVRGQIADGHFRVNFAPSNADYFVLYRGETPAVIQTPVALGLDVATLTDPEAPIAPSAYYRAQRIPRIAPLDSDRDGLDDLSELANPTLLNPLLQDSQQDPDNDGWTNAAELEAATNPRDAASQPAIQTIATPTLQIRHTSAAEIFDPSAPATIVATPTISITHITTDQIWSESTPATITATPLVAIQFPSPDEIFNPDTIPPGTIFGQPIIQIHLPNE